MNEERPPAVPERPPEVLYAVALLCASLVLSLALLPLGRPDVAKPPVLIAGILAILILRGHNWARVLLVILLIIRSPFAFPAVLIAFQTSPSLAVIRLLLVSLQIMAVVLLLQKSTRDWFKFIKMRKLMVYQGT